MSSSQGGGAEAIRLDGVSFTYPHASAPAMQDVTLSVPQGQCVVVTGPSGCGKTTLTRVINGLIPHVYEGDMTGTVQVDGQEVATWDAGQLGTVVGSVFQNPRSQFVNLDTTSEIAFGCENLGLPRDEMVRRVDSAVGILGARSFLGRSVEELSGGQKQRVIIASALAMEPGIIVMDEPTASLDAEAMRQLAQAVAHLKQHGKTVVISEHRLWWLKDVADRVIQMHDGRIVGSRTMEEHARLPRAERRMAGERGLTLEELEERPVRRALAQGDDALVAEGIHAGYRRGADVLTGAALALQSGRVLGLLGENGAGKTTLLRCLAGLTRERAGRISLDGRPLLYRKRPERVHLVMQEPGYQLFADSVREELVRTAKDRGATPDEAEERAASLISLFGLESLEERHPLSLSGGERQRLAIAAGICQDARVMVLDEPTSGLDHRNMQRVAEALRTVADGGAAVCVVTHDYEFLCTACDDVAELADGTVSARAGLDGAGKEQARAAFGF